IPSGWSNEDQNSVPGQQVIFEPSDNPIVLKHVATGEAFTSSFLAPGADNGFVWANSDRALGEAPTNFHVTELTSPPIDCSTEDQVFFSMYAFIGVFELDADDNAVLRVSTDNTDWTEFTLFPDLTVEERWSDNPTFAAINISDIAANESTVYLQIRWIGVWEYFMAIDDIKLSRDDPRPAANMRINDFAAISPNIWRPVTQVEPVGFIADVENVGSAAQTNIELSITVTQASNIVFNDQLNYGDMVPDQLTENILFPNQFIVPEAFASYQATYELTYDNITEQDNPNFLNYNFPIVVTDTIFAKEDGVTRGADPAEDNEYSYGCVYHINTDHIGETPLVASSITFGVTNAEDIAGEFANILLLEWEGDLDGNFAAQASEYDIVGINSYQFTGNEGPMETITVAASEDGIVPLVAGKYYIPVIQFSTEDPDQRYILQASDEYDYQAMQFYTDSINAPRWASALDIGNQGTYSLLGFGFDIVPLVRLGITLGPVTTQAPQLADGAMRVFPNPANEVVNILFDLVEETEGILYLYDVKGTLIHQQQLEYIYQNKSLIDTKSLASGFYELRLVTPLGVRQLPLSVQH
ncbi:MAG: T9SS type A sorting domain-containing protein, partial [Bacteroidota bacterium]